MNSSNLQLRAQQRGFNLVEVMVTVTVLAILVTLAAPSYTAFIADQRINSTAREILRNIQYARSEAISRNTAVNLQRVSGTAKLWEAGWTIFTDADRAGNTNIAAGDTLLRTVAALPNGVTLRTDGAADRYLSFRADGQLNEAPNTSARFVICDDRGVGSGRTVTINNIGRARLEPTESRPASCTP